MKSRRGAPSDGTMGLSHLPLTLAEIRCLVRTRIAADFGRREITTRELLDYMEGRPTPDGVWDRLKASGFVANTRGIGVRLTPKGARALRDLGR
jgi:hypothetical protein